MRQMEVMKPASNMRKLVWNSELEAVAQRWADQCTFGHDSMRNTLDGTQVRPAQGRTIKYDNNIDILTSIINKIYVSFLELVW